MEFPNEAKYLLDWSPASGWSYTDYLLEKKFDPTLWFAVPEGLLKRIASLEQLEKRGYVQSTNDPHEGYVILSRNVAGIEQSVRLGSSELSSVLRWNFLQLSIGIDRVNDSLKQLNETLRNLSLAWAYEQFVQARTEYNRGLYGDALSFVKLAIDGSGSRKGCQSEFRFYYLLGRIQLGGWFGDYKNAARDIIDPEKAEQAFLEAVRYRKHASPLDNQDDLSANTDIAQMLLWAARAAFIAGKGEPALAHVRDALGLLIPATRGLYSAAQYLYAKFLCAHRDGGDLKAAAEALETAVTAENSLLLEAAVEPEFVARPEVLETLLTNMQTAQQTAYRKQESDCDALLKKVNAFTFDETAAEVLLRDELTSLRRAREAMGKESANGGVWDLAAAIQIAKDVMPKPGFLFGLFKTRFNKDCLQRWETSKVTIAAKDAGTFLKFCEEEFKKAEDFYRKNGGFNRSGGADKFGYGVIFALLAVYMFFAQARWGGNAIIVAILFLAAGLWLFLGFLRVKLGLVEGYEKYRSTKSALQAAQTDATKKDDVSAKAWLNYQRLIDDLAGLSAPF